MLGGKCDQRSVFRGGGKCRAIGLRRGPGSESGRLHFEIDQAPAESVASRSESRALDLSVVGRIDLRGDDGNAVTGEWRARALGMRDSRSRSGKAARIGDGAHAGKNLDGG